MQAFPHDSDGGPGMELRDYFAAHEQSLPPISWIRAKFGDDVNTMDQLKGVDLARCLSAWRYQMADQMIKEREFSKSICHNFVARNIELVDHDG